MDFAEYMDALYDGCDESLILNLVAWGDDGLQGECHTLKDIRSKPETVPNFVQRHQASERNVGHVLNLLKADAKPPNGRARIDDLAPIEYVFADIDPPHDADDDWLDKSKVELDKTKCTALNVTGAGLQIIRRLNQQCSEKVAKRLLASMVKEFGGDTGAESLNQPVRLPGTTNYPNAGKRKNGRQVSESHNLKLDADYRAPTSTPDDFIEALPLSAKMRTLLMTGELDGKDLDNSDARRRVLAELISKGVSHEDLETLLRDYDDLPIAPKDGRRITSAFVRAQIRSAEKSVTGWLAEMNQSYFVTMQSGSTVIGEYLHDPALKRHRYEFTSTTAKRAFYANKRVTVGNRQVNQWDAWMRNPFRREYRNVVLAPNKPPGELPDGTLNLWQGFACEPQQGDIGLFDEFLFEIICDGEDEMHRWLWGFMARSIQQPHEQGEVAFAMRGDKGVGKGTFAKIFGSLFGQHYLQIQNPDHLLGRFNSHLRETLLLFADELFFAGDKKHEGILKGLITEDYLPIEQKFLPVVNVPNMLTLIMASNNSWVVPASDNERRYAVTNVSSAKMQDHSYFEKIHAVDRKALLWSLMNHDISDFNHREVPDSQGLRDQKDQSLDAMERFWLDRLREGNHGHQSSTNWERVPRTVVFEQYMRFKRNIRGPGDCPSSESEFGKRLREMLPDGWPKRGHRMDWMEGPDKYVSGNPYVLPTLEECRDWFESKYLCRSVDWGHNDDFVEDTKSAARSSITDLESQAYRLQRKLRQLAGHSDAEQQAVQKSLEQVENEISSFKRELRDDSYDDSPY